MLLNMFYNRFKGPNIKFLGLFFLYSTALASSRLIQWYKLRINWNLNRRMHSCSFNRLWMSRLRGWPVYLKLGATKASLSLTRILLTSFCFGSIENVTNRQSPFSSSSKIRSWIGPCNRKAAWEKKQSTRGPERKSWAYNRAEQKGQGVSIPYSILWGERIIKGEPLVVMVTVDLGFHLADIAPTRIGDPLLPRKLGSRFHESNPLQRISIFRPLLE